MYYTTIISHNGHEVVFNNVVASVRDRENTCNEAKRVKSHVLDFQKRTINT